MDENITNTDANVTESNNSTPQGGETQPSAWYAGLEEGLVDDKIKSFTAEDGSLNTAELLKSYKSAQSMIGGSVKIPKEGATSEELGAFYTKLGRPETAEGYDWEAPEGIKINDDKAFKAFASNAHEAGLTKAQYKAVLNGYSDITKDFVEQRNNFIANQEKTTKAELAQEWGASFDSKLGGTLKLMESAGVKEKLESAGLLYDKDIIKAFYRVSTDSSPTSQKGGDTDASSTQATIDSLMASDAYRNPTHPKNAETVRQINNLIASKNS